MRTRFLKWTLVIVTATLLVALLLSTILTKRQYTRETKLRLDAILVVAADLGKDGFNSPSDNLKGFVDSVASDLRLAGQDIRFTLISLDGVVRADSATSAPEMENHGSRPEVMSAISSGSGYDIRKSATVNIRYYYAALRSGDLILRAALPMDHVLQNRLFLVGVAGVALLVAMVLALIAVRTLSGRLTRPIEAMATAARAYSTGDLKTRMEPAPDEFGRLSEAFNEMADRLERSYAELEESNDKLGSMLQGMDDGIAAIDPQGHFLLLTDKLRSMIGEPAGHDESLNIHDGGPNYLLVRDVLMKAMDKRLEVREEIYISRPEERVLTVYATPLHRIRDEGALAVVADISRMRKLEQIRSEFVANVTHELKTPLTSIRGYVELLKTGERDAKTTAQFYEIIEIEAERLQALIDDLLQLSEIEGGRDDASALQPVSLSEIAEDIVARLAPVAEKAGVSLHTELDSTLMLRASRLRLEQLFYNLADNAIKYNQPGGEVRISVRRERKFTVVCVSDTGIGIPEEHQERIFERFYRVDRSRSRQLGGTGLGLSIVKHIVSLYNGDISLVSRPGQGSLFIIRFP